MTNTGAGLASRHWVSMKAVVQALHDRGLPNTAFRSSRQKLGRVHRTMNQHQQETTR